MEYKIQYIFSVLHWTLRSAEVIEHRYTFTGNTAVHIFRPYGDNTTGSFEYEQLTRVWASPHSPISSAWKTEHVVAFIRIT